VNGRKKKKKHRRMWNRGGRTKGTGSILYSLRWRRAKKKRKGATSETKKKKGQKCCSSPGSPKRGGRKGNSIGSISGGGEQKGASFVLRPSAQKKRKKRIGALRRKSRYHRKEARPLRRKKKGPGRSLFPACSKKGERKPSRRRFPIAPRGKGFPLMNSPMDSLLFVFLVSGREKSLLTRSRRLRPRRSWRTSPVGPASTEEERGASRRYSRSTGVTLILARPGKERQQTKEEPGGSSSFFLLPHCAGGKGKEDLFSLQRKGEHREIFQRKRGKKKGRYSRVLPFCAQEGGEMCPRRGG